MFLWCGVSFLSSLFSLDHCGQHYPDAFAPLVGSLLCGGWRWSRNTRNTGLWTDLNGQNETTVGSAGILFDVCPQVLYNMDKALGGKRAENCRRTPQREQNWDSGSTEPCHPLDQSTVTCVVPSPLSTSQILTGFLHLIFLNQKSFRVCHFSMLLFSCFVSVVC